ncbi:MAG: tartrate dehydrogenase, partial [Myxococcales bacterium]|nr:tartrate dehydrogenase [Myxococcales bacterium]
IERAVHAALAKPENRTRDIGGTADLKGITEAIISHMS